MRKHGSMQNNSLISNLQRNVHVYCRRNQLQVLNIGTLHL